MRAIVFCNSAFGFPAIELIAQQGLLLGLCSSEPKSEDSQQLEFLAAQYTIPIVFVNKNNCSYLIKKQLQSLKPDVVLVMTFPFKISTELLTIPPKGFYNFHYARLPEYRGSQPVFWEIYNQEPYGAVSVHKIDGGLDTGQLLIQEPVAIHPEKTYATHLFNLSQVGVSALHKLYVVLNQGIENNLLRVQDESKAHVYTKPVLKDLIIQWDVQSAKEIRALVKACNPWNKGAFTFWKKQNFKITEVTLLNTYVDKAVSGEVIGNDKVNGLVVQCKNKEALRIDIVYTHEGFQTGIQLTELGLKLGDLFTSQPQF